MLDLQKLEKIITIEFSDDESYNIRFVTDEFLRQMAAEHKINFREAIQSFFTMFEVQKEMPEKTPEDKKVKREKQMMDDLDIFNIIQDVVQNIPFAVEIACHACVGWKGVIGLDGKPYECNDENKRVIFEKFSTRTMFIYRRCRYEKLFINYQLDDDVKN
jgi:hypothetical protein